jgi:vitamin B12 transporter
MKPFHLFSLSALGAALLGLSATASADTELAPVVVTATRTPVTADETLAAVTVISRQQIDANPTRDLTEILRYYGGIDVVRSGGAGQQTSIFMRGANSNQTLVMIDGVRINEGISGLANIQYLGTDNIDHIEIVKGPRSTLYGADAIGGVINIITRRPTDTATTASLTVAGERTVIGQLRQDFRASNTVSGSVNVGSENTDGYHMFPNSTFNTGNKSRNAGVDLDYKKDDLSLRGHFEQNQGVNFYEDGYTPVKLSQDFSNTLGSVEAALQVSENYKTTLRVSSFSNRLDQNDLTSLYDYSTFPATFLGTELDFAHTRRTEVDWQNDYTLPGNNLVSIGGSYADERLSGLSFGNAETLALNSSAAYIQDQWQYNGFSAQVGGRYENHKQYGEHYTGEAALGYAFTKQDRVYVSHSLGFRAPDGAELVGPNGNLKLLPEQATNREIGFHHDDSNWNLQAALFRNDVRQLIVCPFFGSCDNVSKAQLSGAELGFGLHGKAWSWQNKANYTKAIDADTKADLLRRPRRSLSTALDYQFEQYSVGGEVVSQSFSKDFSSIVIPGFAVLNLHTGVQLNKSVALRFAVDNVANKHYGLATNGLLPDNSTQYYAAQPRLVSATVNVKY